MARKYTIQKQNYTEKKTINIQQENKNLHVYTLKSTLLKRTENLQKQEIFVIRINNTIKFNLIKAQIFNINSIR